ncbi:hypothetical protein TYRP_021500 [Tyrophagus putrescentiae]|nr:hypothetical protein TYRP_021500 [Tyrophagus putrescentiae]
MAYWAVTTVLQNLFPVQALVWEHSNLKLEKLVLWLEVQEFVGYQLAALPQYLLPLLQLNLHHL